MNEREYLISIGLAKPGRGRFSAEAKQALAKAKSDGMTFDLPAYKTIQAEALESRKSREPKPKINKPKSVPKSSGVIELQSRTVAAGTRFVHTDLSGKQQFIGDANICGKCGVSLGWHRCSSPTALVRGQRGFVPVEMVV